MITAVWPVLMMLFGVWIMLIGIGIWLSFTKEMKSTGDRIRVWFAASFIVFAGQLMILNGYRYLTR